MKFDDYEKNNSLDNNSNNKRKKRKSRSRSSSTFLKHRHNLKNHHSRGIYLHYTIEYKLNKILSREIPGRDFYDNIFCKFNKSHYFIIFKIHKFFQIIIYYFFAVIFF